MSVRLLSLDMDTLSFREVQIFTGSTLPTHSINNIDYT
jgi:hypothetical protein